MPLSFDSKLDQGRKWRLIYSTSDQHACGNFTPNVSIVLLHRHTPTLVKWTLSKQKPIIDPVLTGYGRSPCKVTPFLLALTP